MPRHLRPLTLVGAVVVTALSLLVAGCGGKSGSPGVANVATTPTSTASTSGGGLNAFSACMRAHGVAGFPDPDSTGQISKLQVVNLAKADPSKFNAAQTACIHLAPGGSLGQESVQEARTHLADGLSFARCMRSHGVARFPDPTPQGQLTIEMVVAQGINVHSPAVLHAVQTCLPASHGGITPAMVNHALSEVPG
jgi:hypothetical protein